MANCTLGIVGLCGILIGMPGAAYMLKSIAWFNSFLSSLVVALSESTYSGGELEGGLRVVVVCVLALGLLIAARSVARRPGIVAGV